MRNLLFCVPTGECFTWKQKVTFITVSVYLTILFFLNFIRLHPYFGLFALHFGKHYSAMSLELCPSFLVMSVNSLMHVFPVRMCCFFLGWYSTSYIFFPFTMPLYCCAILLFFYFIFFNVQCFVILGQVNLLFDTAASVSSMHQHAAFFCDWSVACDGLPCTGHLSKLPVSLLATSSEPSLDTFKLSSFTDLHFSAH